jgi:tyrosine-protein phosphatase non-receptor type 11
MSTKWFHAHLNGVQAEEALRTSGFDGSFLVRPSQSNPGDFTLSVRQTGGKFAHIKIQNTGDFFDLYGGEKFASLAELVNHYMNHEDELQETNGEMIELKQPLLSEDPTSERWYHGSLSGKQAEDVLMAKDVAIGTFLVRASTSTPGDFCFSIRENDKVTHVMINYKNSSYSVGSGEQFSDLTSIVKHYMENPMVQANGRMCRLKQPLHTTRFHLNSIQGRIDELEKNPTAFFDEFQELQELESKIKHTRDVGSMPQNRPKNRYKNILPFDETRVRIKTSSKEPGADYINASYIKGENDDKAYVACQGPLPATVVSFWEMVMQLNVRIIVMCTNLVEGGKQKCAKYWPDETPMLFGKVKVEPLGEQTNPIYCLREFSVMEDGKKGSKRTVRQFHFLAWPDHGVPEKPETVLQFLHTVRQVQKSIRNPGPIVVHCSAGIGRTGTFIGIDFLMNYIGEGDKSLDRDIDVQKRILDIRAQRSGMVQTEPQYRFLYEAVRQHVTAVMARLMAENKTTAPAGEVEYRSITIKEPKKTDDGVVQALYDASSLKFYFGAK